MDNTSIYEVDPIHDERWAQLVERHRDASIFHTREWLASLRDTYGYEPIAVTTSGPREELRNGLVLCRVSSRITGTRLVSLPFSDHCQPLLEDVRDLGVLTDHLRSLAESGRYKYVELRPMLISPELVPDFRGSSRFALHSLDLRPDLGRIFGQFHVSCVQRRIVHAEALGLTYQEEKSEAALKDFYRLQLRTRRRHGLPPQPYRWFHTLREHFGSRMVVHFVSQESKPIACMVTIRHRATLVFKYAASNAKLHKLGSVPLLYWRVIQSAKCNGVEKIDLGRSGLADAGLIQFKERIGATRMPLTYLCSPRKSGTEASLHNHLHFAKRFLAHLPGPLLQASGTLLYRHLG